MSKRSQVDPVLLATLAAAGWLFVEYVLPAIEESLAVGAGADAAAGAEAAAGADGAAAGAAAGDAGAEGTAAGAAEAAADAAFLEELELGGEMLAATMLL